MLGLAVAAMPCSPAGCVPGALAAAQAATLEGVVAEPEGSGARVQVFLSGTFHYMVTPHVDRIIVTLDEVAAERAATYHISVGPVTGIALRPDDDHRSRVDVIITTRTPVDVVESFLDERGLVIRLGPPGAVARKASHLPVPTSAQGADRTAPLSPLPARERAPVLASRTMISRVIRLQAGAGQVIQIDGLVRVAVGDPQVLEAVPVSNRELLVTGRTAGRTTMYVWEGAGHLLAYAVEVLPATDRLTGLRSLLAALFPRAAILVTEVPGSPNDRASQEPTPREGGAVPATPTPYVGERSSASSGAVNPGDAPRAGTLPAPPTSPNPAGTGTPVTSLAVVPAGPAPQAAPRGGSAIVLSGAVENQIDHQRVEAVARAFAPTVVNLLNVRRPVQLKLQVEVVELSRSALRSLGVSWGGGQQIPGASPSLNGGVYNLQLITGPGTGTSGLDLLVAQIQALTQQGLARLLAEPSLIVLAGRTASLLLGGQVPIPVAGSNGSVTIEYRDFGVILNAHPDYQEDGRVFMQIAPEVSTLDFANAIKVSGFTVPALRVRRAQTMVSMLPAQTLVVGGLLQQQDADLAQKIPVLGDLPIIGPLFQSKAFQRQETELVIFVTPVLVEPGDGTPPPTTP